MYTRREYLRQELGRNRMWTVLGCAAAAGVSGGVYAWNNPEHLVYLVGLLSSFLGGVLRYNHEKAQVERIRRELDEL